MDLLTRLRARDQSALETLVHEHTRRLYRAARGMGLSGEAAEDVTQDVFVTFFETLDRFEGRSSLATWLFGILRHKVQEHRRAGMRDEADPIDDVFEARFDVDGSWLSPPVAVDRQLASAQITTAVEECQGELPGLHRDVFHLRHVEGLSAADVAAIVGCRANHVAVLFHRARTRLRECLEVKGWGRQRLV